MKPLISQAWTTRVLRVTLALLLATAAQSLAQNHALGRTIGLGTRSVSAPPASQQLAKGKFLVASRELMDPNFLETVILLADYGPNGASGLVVNRPSRTTLAELLPDEEWLRPRNDTIYIGGPVAQDRLLLLIRTAKQPEASHLVFDDVYISGSASTLRDLTGRESESTKFLPYLGYAGWAPGQLENEVRRGDWWIVPADTDAIFDQPSTSLWQKLIERSAGEWAGFRGNVIDFSGPDQFVIPA